MINFTQLYLSYIKLIFICSGSPEILLLQYHMRLSHAIANWYMPAFWMQQSLYLVHQTLDYDVVSILLLIFLQVWGDAFFHHVTCILFIWFVSLGIVQFLLYCQSIYFCHQKLVKLVSKIFIWKEFNDSQYFTFTQSHVNTHKTRITEASYL